METEVLFWLIATGLCVFGISFILVKGAILDKIVQDELKEFNTTLKERQ